MATTFDVVPGDTVWALTRRALEAATGQRPTNAQILEIVNQVQVPSGNVDLIFPGEQITIPVGGAGGAGSGDGGVRGGSGPVGPGAGSAQYPSDMYPDGPFGPPRAPLPPRGGDPDAAARLPAPGVGPGLLAEPAPSGGLGNENLRFTPPMFGRGAFDTFRAPEDRVREYREDGDFMDLLRESIGDSLPFVARGPSLVARGAQSLRALPSGVRPALPAGPAGGYPAAGGGRMPFQFGSGAPARTRWPSENEIRALRQPQTRGFR